MSAALIGALGGLAGIVLTGGAQTVIALFDRRRGARVAARLIYMDLVWAGLAVDAARNAQNWNDRVDWDAFTAAWPEQREPLARVLSTTDFLTVASALTAIHQLRVIRAGDFAAERPPGHPPPFTAPNELFEVYGPNIQVAMLIVHRASFTRWERWRGEAAKGELEAVSGPPGSPS